MNARELFEKALEFKSEAFYQSPRYESCPTKYEMELEHRDMLNCNSKHRELKRVVKALKESLLNPFHS